MSRQCHAILAPWVVVVVMAMLLLTISLFSVGATPESSIDSPAFVTRAHFLEPLIAMAPSTPAEDESLEGALTRYEERLKPDDLSALTEYLASHPNSPWRVALNLNLGLAWKHYGYLSRALGAFEEAWRAGKEASGTYQKPLVDRAVGELAMLRAGVGHEDELKALLAEIGDRPLSNPGGQRVDVARQTLWSMENDTAHRYLCGPLALKFLMMENPATTSEELRFVNRYRAGPNGVSLAELAHLAGEKNLSLTPVFRGTDQPVPVPSIIHWKTGHYAAILGRENGGYRVRDPVLGLNPHFVPEGAVEAEASGYFLAQADVVEGSGWRPVAAEEAGRIFGRGYTQNPVPNQGPPADPPPDSCGGMCGYNIAELAVAVTLSDHPVGYTPPIGPSAKVTISYNQREAYQPGVFGYFNVSPNWTISWLRFIQDDPNNAGNNVMRYQADGDAWMYTGYNSATGAFTPEEGDASVLTLVSKSPVLYERSLRDGSTEVYSQSDGSKTYPRNVFLTKIIDPQGNALSLNYTISGGHVRLASLTDATGRNTVFTYGSTVSPLLITEITDPFGRSAKLTYDASGRLSSITDVIGLTSKFTYDSSSLVNSLTTPYGTTKFAYGGTGNTRFVDVTDPLGLHEREETLQPAPVPSSDAVVPANMNLFNAYLNYRDSFHWDQHEYGQAGCTVNGGCNYGDARVTHFYHDAANINIEWYTIEARQEPLETRVWFNYPNQQQNYSNGTYDQPSVVGRIIDGHISQEWQKSYNTFGAPTQIIDPAGRTTNLTYAANGIDLVQMQQVTSSGPQTTASYSYNSQHQPLTYTDAAGQVTHYAYNKAGQLTQLTLPTGLVWRFTYDTLGRLTVITNPNGKAQASYSYDAFDRVLTATDSEGYTLNYAYDAADRVTKITYPDSTSRTYAYSLLDLVSATDREGRTTRYYYDADRRLIATVDPLGNIARYTYWENGKLQSLTDPKGNKTIWYIDLQGRLGVKQYADGSRITYGYDDSGRLASIRDALGQIKQYTYTVDDRVARIVYSATPNPTPSVTFAYDPAFPRLVSMTDGTGTTSYTYTPVGALGALQRHSEAGPRGAIVYGYDALGRMIGRSIAGNIDTFQYDGLNRLTTHDNPLGNFASTYLGQTGQITGRTQTLSTKYPASTAWSYLPNSGDRRLAAVTNNAMRAFSFTTTPEDLITKTVETGSKSWTYAYDNDNRLTSAIYSTGFTRDLSLDPNGNMTALKSLSATLTFAYNDLNELVSSTGATYTYDLNGNLLSDGQRTYSYDAENRLVRIAYAGTGAATSFAYDGRGRRVTSVEAAPGKTPVAAYYQWCGARLCRQFSAAGTARLYYDEGEALPGESLYYGPDQLGSPRNFAVAASKTGTVGALDFDPFGNALTSPAAPLPDFRFAGMFYHANSGLYLTHYRAYDPRTDRWLSRDPLGEDFGKPGATPIATDEPVTQSMVLAPLVPNFAVLLTPAGGALAKPQSFDPAQPQFGGRAPAPRLGPPALILPSIINGENLYLYVSAEPVYRVDPLGLCDNDPCPSQCAAQCKGSFIFYPICYQLCMAGCEAGRASDRRLKRDIVLLARLNSGIGLYRFRYLWSDQVYVGVIAQEVAEKFPDAVVSGPDGYLRVNYDRLGLKMMTWEEWQGSAFQRTSLLSPRPEESAAGGP